MTSSYDMMIMLENRIKTLREDMKIQWDAEREIHRVLDDIISCLPEEDREKITKLRRDRDIVKWNTPTKSMGRGE